MPTGRVRFFDTEKGFGFIAGEDGQQVYVHASVLNTGDELLAGDRVEYSVADGKRGPQALSVEILSQAKRARRTQQPRKDADDMAVIVEDLVKLLDGVGTKLKNGQYPERSMSRKLAQMLRHVAEDFDV